MSDSTPVSSKPKFSLSRVLTVLLPLMLLTVGGVLYWNKTIEAETKAANEKTVLAKLGISDTGKSTPKLLDTKFTDADSNLVADPPKDPAQFIDPETIVFSYIGADDSDRQQQVWQEFTAAVAAATKKNVEYLIITKPDDQIKLLKASKLHLTAINTGKVPEAVRDAGFVPDVTFADAEGKVGHTMKFLVPADSKITKPEQLRNVQIAFVNRGSNSGFKAPLVMLMKEQGLQPLRDFDYRFTFSHDDSIAGIASKNYPAAPVASDMLARAEARGDIKPDQYRVINESEWFPSAALGHVYNLKPELVEQIKKVYKDFVWTGTGLEKEFAPSGIVKFAPADYKQQWSLIRRIDDALGPEPTVDPEMKKEPEIPETEKMAE
jgi:phosphonate transport system substrate-binding protein